MDIIITFRYSLDRGSLHNKDREYKDSDIKCSCEGTFLPIVDIIKEKTESHIGYSTWDNKWEAFQVLKWKCTKCGKIIV